MGTNSRTRSRDLVKSRKSRLVRSSEVVLIVNTMLTSWAAKSTAALGGGQLLGSEFDARWDGEIPTWTKSGDDGKAVVTKTELYRGVMTLQSADRIINESAMSCLARFDASYVASNRTKKAGALFRRRPFIRGMAKEVMAKERLIALGALEIRALKSNRRRGRQVISTTKADIPVGNSMFGGRVAVRLNVGRPPLPADTWIARYLTRKAKRQQKNKTAIKRTRPLPVPPRTAFERPKQMQIIASA